jgi:hypothetical protein
VRNSSPQVSNQASIYQTNPQVLWIFFRKCQPAMFSARPPKRLLVSFTGSISQLRCMVILLNMYA